MKINYEDKWYIKVLKGLYIAGEYAVKYIPRLVSLLTKSGREKQAIRKTNVKEHRQIQRNKKLDRKKIAFDKMKEVK